MPDISAVVSPLIDLLGPLVGQAVRAFVGTTVGTVCLGLVLGGGAFVAAARVSLLHGLLAAVVVLATCAVLGGILAAVIVFIAMFACVAIFGVANARPILVIATVIAGIDSV